MTNSGLGGVHFFTDTCIIDGKLMTINFTNCTFKDISTTYTIGGGALASASQFTFEINYCKFSNITVNMGSILFVATGTSRLPTVVFNDCSSIDCSCKTGNNDNGEIIYIKCAKLDLNRCNFSSKGVAGKAQIYIYYTLTVTIEGCNLKMPNNEYNHIKVGSGTVTVVINDGNCFSSKRDFAFSGSVTVTNADKYDQCLPSPTFSKSVDFSLSSEFIFSNKFSKSMVFIPTKMYSKSSMFQDTGIFSISAKFGSTVDFISTGKMTQSDQFDKSKLFSKSLLLTNSMQFSKTSIFDDSAHFFKQTILPSQIHIVILMFS